MKTVLFVIFCLINVIFGLECYYNGRLGEYFEECPKYDYFCILMTINGSGIDPKGQTSYQGCSIEMEKLEKYGVKCNESGSFNVTFPDVIVEYSCCETDNCNLSTVFYPTFLIVLSIVFQFLSF